MIDPSLTRRAALTGLAATPFVVPALATAQTPGTAATPDPRPRSYALLNQAAPSFELPNLNGSVARLSDYRGRPTILYFWGLWCPDCVRDGPNVARLAQAVAADRRLGFLAIHTRGRFGRWGSVPAYFQESGYSYPVAFQNGREWARDVYRIEWFPTFLGIDRAGVIRAFRTDLGATGGDQFLAQVRGLL